jgi:hypothetical protein
MCLDPGTQTVTSAGGLSSTPHSHSAVVPPRAAPVPAASTAGQVRVMGGTGPVNVAYTPG